MSLKPKRQSGTIYTKIVAFMLGIIGISFFFFGRSVFDNIIGGIFIVGAFTIEVIGQLSSRLSVTHNSPDDHHYKDGPSTPNKEISKSGQYRVVGVDRETGYDTDLVVEAQTRDNAKAKAELKGIIVTSIEYMESVKPLYGGRNGRFLILANVGGRIVRQLRIGRISYGTIILLSIILMLALLGKFAPLISSTYSRIWKSNDSKISELRNNQGLTKQPNNPSTEKENKDTPRIDVQYDRFKNNTTIIAGVDNAVYSSPNEKWHVFFLARHEGKHIIEISDALLLVGIVIASNKNIALDYGISPTFRMIVDGDNISLSGGHVDVDYDSDRNVFKTKILFKVTAEQCLKMANSKKIECQLGNTEFILPDMYIEACKLMTAKVGLLKSINK